MSLFISKAKAEGRNPGWMYALGVFFSLVCGQLIGCIPLLVVMIRSKVFSLDILANPERYDQSRNSILLMLLMPFVISLVFLLIYLKYVHRKRLLVSFTSFARFNWKKLFFAFFLWIILSALLQLAGYVADPSQYSFHFAGKDFFILLAISIFILPLQTTYEELLFRSYLLQSIGMRTAIRFVPFIITSLLFGLMHIANPEVEEFGYIIMIEYVGMGMLLGLLTLMSDSLEFALGLHAANNLYGSLILTSGSSVLNTDALFRIQSLDFSAWVIAQDVAVMIVFYGIIHFVYKLPPVRTLFERRPATDIPVPDAPVPVFMPEV